MIFKPTVHSLTFLFTALLLLTTHNGAADNKKDIAEYTLQNGMQIFVLEDFAAAPIRIEYTCRAGVSRQTPETAGFFPLYTRLFSTAGKAAYENENSAWLISDAHAECAADSSRYMLTVAPAQIETALTQLAYCAFAPVFTDKEVQAQFTALKNEVMNYSYSTAGFINASIDARVYADAPWKQDTGVYPALFTNTPIAEVRSILMNISRTYYVPKNSALFISGGISKEYALALAEKAFGTWQGGAAAPQQNGNTQKILAAKSKMEQRKFVMIDPVFSADLTQIVVQYKSLSMMQADVAAASFNAYTSSFKEAVLSHNELAVRGPEYINVAAAHKNGESRLIFQSLLEKTKTSPAEQAEIFVDCVKAAAHTMHGEELIATRETLVAGYSELFGSSAQLMETLSALWAVSDTAQNDGMPLVNRLLSRPNEIINFNSAELQRAYGEEMPFVFVLVNSSSYNRLAKEFKNAGYELITQKNGSWYTQALYKNITDSNLASSDLRNEIESDSASLYIEQNKAQFSSYSLPNGIPIIFKKNELSSSALILFSIRGGALSSASNPGFFSILINALADNIQKEINMQKANGTIDGTPSVRAETNLTSGTISIESLSDDMSVIIPCISRALVYGNILPTQADGLVYDARSQKRLHNGSTINQLYSRAIYELFAGTPYTAVFDSDRDILEHVQYTDILTSYPQLLDAGKYTVVVVGNFREEIIKSALESSLGIFLPQTSRDTPVIATAAPQFPRNKRVRVTLRHLFMTDISAEEAGPRPLVLVPTTNFSDPVQYWIPSPKLDSPDFAVFNALVHTLRSRLEKKVASISADMTVRAEAATYAVQAAAITITHVDSTNQIDKLYEETAAQILRDAQNAETFLHLAEELQSNWVLTALSGTQTNRGTALLIHEGLEGAANGNREKDAAQYLTNYEIINSVSQETVVALCETYFSGAAPLRLYSKDAKR